MISLPRGSTYTTIMELSPKRPSPLWPWGPNSTIVVYMEPLGYTTGKLWRRMAQSFLLSSCRFLGSPQPPGRGEGVNPAASDAEGGGDGEW